MNSVIRISRTISINPDGHSVIVDGEEILLPRKEFQLIMLLAGKPGKVFTREEIYRSIWQRRGSETKARTIDVHIRRLRERIGMGQIITVKGVGYKLVTG